MLNEQKRRALELRLASGDLWKEHDLVFPARGKYRHESGVMVGNGVPGGRSIPNSLSVRFKRQLAKHGIKVFDAERIEKI